MNPQNPSPAGRYSFVDAIRGPLMLIALGLLLAADQMDKMSFGQTWPALLILFGLLKLVSHLGERHA
jgi:hypothetical protein